MGIVEFFRRLKPHIATYNSPAAYYTFAFSMPQNSNPYSLAKQLLKENIAKCALTYPDRDIWFASRYDDVSTSRKHLSYIALAKDLVDKKIGFLEFALRNPRAALFLARNGLLSFDWRKQSEGDERDNSTRRAIQKVEEHINDLDELMLDAGLFLGAQGAVDEALFNPGYLESSPFIRLQLDTAFVKSKQFQGEDVTTSLLLHRSGVALVTFVLIPGRNLNTDEMLRLSSAGGVTLDEVIVTEDFASHFAFDPGLIAADEIILAENERPWRRIKWMEPILLEDQFLAIASTLYGLARYKPYSGTWFCYTTVFIDGVRCCGSKRAWLKNHRNELAGLVTRLPNYASLKKTVTDRVFDAAHGFGNQEHMSHYFHAGNALLMSWDFGDNIESSSPVEHFHTTALIDYALLQYWQLKQLDLKLSTSDLYDSQSLVAAQAEIALGLEEYRSSQLYSLEARAVERKITDDLEAPRIYGRIVERLEILHQLINSRATTLLAKRNMLVAVAGIFAATLLGFPAIKDLVAAIKQLSPDSLPGILVRPLKPFFQAGDAGVFGLYFIFLIIVAGVLLGVLLAKPQRTLKRASTPKRLGNAGQKLGYELGEASYQQGRDPAAKKGRRSRTKHT